MHIWSARTSIHEDEAKRARGVDAEKSRFYHKSNFKSQFSYLFWDRKTMKHVSLLT